MMKRWRHGKRILPLLAAFSLLLSACGREDLSVLRPQGPVAQGQLDLMKLAITIMVVVLLVVFAIAAFVLIKFRRRPGQNEIPEQVEGNHKLEIIWTVIPLVLVIILAVPTVQQLSALGKDYTKDENALQVKVTAHQYWWEFSYPDLGVTTAQDLIIPTDKTISFVLESNDVIHSFWVPSLAGKIDTNFDGTLNKFHFSAPNEGVYRGKCAELCGPSHAYMEFKVKAVSQEEFDNWVTAMQAPAVLPEDEQLAEKFKSACLSCHAVGDQGGPLGPNLTGIGGRESIASMLLNEREGQEGAPVEENLKEWLHDPQAIKPGNEMPSPAELGLTTEEVDAIAEYLADYKLDYETNSAD
ncbi:cytochrome c oxidase subunit II [Paenibacillus shunpengii]|uniref:Cytochrome c oxidase subunit 2 n=1 Tax=Paenibacillus shunpengii TaxID=2054424 RepID=A0ABW5STC2_9BACL|nr:MULTISPECIES: cytochrome c oxidase subunit II [unclassified Paenibacillus]OMC65461.1 cytochrome c oxidase subunit II [Paenibacillus sp. FSL H7-0326]